MDVPQRSVFATFYIMRPMDNTVSYFCHNSCEFVAPTEISL